MDVITYPCWILSLWQISVPAVTTQLASISGIGKVDVEDMQYTFTLI